LAEFLPIEPTKRHQTVRKRTLTLSARLEDQSLRQERQSPPLACERTQLELGMPDDPLREFVVSVDTAHIRSADQKMARDFEIVNARCGRGGRAPRLDQPGGLRGQFPGYKKDGQKPANAVVPSGAHLMLQVRAAAARSFSQ